jgi:hypothetical protein
MIFSLKNKNWTYSSLTFKTSTFCTYFKMMANYWNIDPTCYLTKKYFYALLKAFLISAWIKFAICINFTHWNTNKKNFCVEPLVKNFHKNIVKKHELYTKSVRSKIWFIFGFRSMQVIYTFIYFQYPSGINWQWIAGLFWGGCGVYLVWYMSYIEGFKWSLFCMLDLV